ncbi:MAG TPA: ABC transporter ATP-binding protein [Syntrophorhabdales bacterium]|nr:ABC transporter ATP-binding protein [Syntrophorhabdales bacterium]
MSDILTVEDIHTYYGESYVLQGLSLKVASSSVVSVVGRNGMGKTTAIRSVMGFTPARRGKILFRGEEIRGLTAFEIARRGLALVPQGRRIFPSLTVRENLAIAAGERGRKGAWNIERVLSLFPVLGKRLSNKGNQLSGGEQQMLAIARALVSNPELILMDEPSEGLAPMVIQEVGGVIKQLRKEGASILLAEQNLPLAMDVADYMYVINKGAMVFEGTPAELQARPEIEQEYLAV